MRSITRRILAHFFTAACVCVSLPTWAAGASSGSPAQMPALSAKPDLSVALQSQPTLAAKCVTGQPAITFHLSINNIGDGASPAVADIHSVWVADALNPLIGGGAALPAIAAHQSIVVDVPVAASATPTLLNGHHVFNVTVNRQHAFDESSFDNNSMTLNVDVPAAFCSAPPPFQAMGLGTPIPTPKPPPTPPSFNAPIVFAHPTPTSSPPLAQAPMLPQIAAPINVWAYNDPSKCAQHVPGLFGGLLRWLAEGRRRVTTCVGLAALRGRGLRVAHRWLSHLSSVSFGGVRR